MKELASDDPLYLQGRAHGWENGYDTAMLKAAEFVAKAKTLVDLMNDVERNHGGLWGTKTLRARDELALELSKWR